MFYLKIEGKVKITKKAEGRVRISVDIVQQSEEVQTRTLWYEVEQAYQDYLYSDRVDAFLVALLPYCMINGYDIYVSDKTSVSADLLYQLTEILIPSLKDAAPFRPIRIEANPIYKGLSKGTGIGTGASRGVDSFYTILKHMEGLFPLTHLTLFNVQGFGEYGGDAARKNFQRDVKEAWRVCRELNREWGACLTLVTVDSNIQEEFPVGTGFAGTFRDAGAILLLKQLFKIYYFAADTRLETFGVQACGRFSSPWLYYCLSTENYRIQLFGTDMDRLDKVEYISRFPVTYDNLRVCRGPFLFGRKGMEYQYKKNCTFNCDKCRHTVMELIAVGKLEKYEKSFDLDLVQKKFPELIAEVISKKDELFFKEIYQCLCEKGLLEGIVEKKKEIMKGNEGVKNYDVKVIELLDYFLQKMQAGVCLTEQLICSNYHTAAIYGMGRLGRRLYDEIKSLVVYEIDRNKEMVYGNVPIKNLDEELEPVDLVVTTTVRDIEEIRAALAKKVTCRIMTLKELLELSE
jgi:hypothetical protein